MNLVMGSLAAMALLMIVQALRYQVWLRLKERKWLKSAVIVTSMAIAIVVFVVVIVNGVESVGNSKVS